MQNTGLVRQEFRDRTAFYQIISEFLVPWIRDQKADRARIEAERTLTLERQEAAERLAQEREAAEQKLALQSAEADRRRAQDLAETLRKVRRSRAVLAVLLLLLLCGWSLAAWQTGQARREKAIAVQEKNAADAARETAAHEKEVAQSAEDAARTALEQNARTASAAEERLFDAARALSKIQLATSELLEEMSKIAATSGLQGSDDWKQLTQKLDTVIQTTGAESQQVATSAQQTRQEAGQATTASGWSIYGRFVEGQTWNERYFRNESSREAIPTAGDIVIADTFVNVRQRPSSYDQERKQWVLERIVGVIAPQQRIKVAEVHQVRVPGDAVTRLWIRGEAVP